MSGDGAPLPAGIEAVLFDLDGTLGDADAVWRGAIARTLAPCYERYPALRTLGSPEAIYDSVLWPLAAERGAAVGGEWDDEFMRHALREFLAEHAERDDGYADELLSQYARERARGTYRRYADAVPALETLLGRYRLGLITNGPGEHQRSRIEPLGLDRYFEAIAVSGKLGVRKPDPAIFRHVLAALSVTAAASVYVGDSLEADVAGARAAGWRRCGSTATAARSQATTSRTPRSRRWPNCRGCSESSERAGYALRAIALRAAATMFSAVRPIISSTSYHLPDSP